ncbi:MAG: hypothetical protein P4L51_19470 [Puia sp.]|nr:hypothetical protein [Puia sp.]
MANSGYSGTPLIKKLGIKESYKIWLLHPPADYSLWLEKDLSSQLCKSTETPDWVHLFAANDHDFISGIKKLRPVWQKNSALVIWISWYKKSAGVQTDLTEDKVRTFALENGLVDIKVCAVNEQWSGLKLVVPVSKR